jgi:hypothetical protein
MSEEEDDRKPTKSWSEKIREARAQARAHRQAELDAALAADDVEEFERLTLAEDNRIHGRRRAKLEGAIVKRDAKALAPKTDTVRWADNEASRDWRAGKRSGGTHRNSARFALQPGAMVRLVSDARVYTEGSWVMARKITKGTLGILIDAPPSDMHGHVAVMFGADIYKIECKKLRQLSDEEE